MGEATESHELAHGQARDKVVLLAQDRQGACQLGGLRRGDVEAPDLDGALVDAEETPNHGQERGLTRPVGTHERRDAARRDVEGDRADTH